MSVPRSLAPPLPTASGNSGASPAAGSFASSRASPVLRSDWQALYFTVLDPDMQMRFLEKKRGWSDADCVREASRLSRHLPTPHRVSVVARPFVSLPVPQIVLSPHQRFPTSRSVAVDLRPLGRSVCVLDLAFGESLFAGFMLECRRTGSGEILSRIARGEVGISVLGAMSDAFRPVPLEAASVHTFVWDRPVEQHGAPGADLPEDPLEEVSSRSLAEVALQIADPPWFQGHNSFTRHVATESFALGALHAGSYGDLTSGAHWACLQICRPLPQSQCLEATCAGLYASGLRLALACIG